MEKENPSRPVGIRVDGSCELIVKGAKFKGDMDAMVATNNSIILAEDITHEVPASTENKEAQQGSGNAAEHWYKKPIGILGLSILGALLSAAAIWSFKHYLS